MKPGQEEHDRLRAELPAGSVCIADCPYCALPEEASKEEKVSEKVYDQQTLDTLLADVRSKAAQEAKAETAAELAELQAMLEEKSEALVAAEAKVEALESAIAEREEQARLAILADERASQVAEVTAFTEQQIDERKAAWAEMSEDAFALLLTDFRTVTESARALKEDPADPPASAFSTTRETAGAKGTDMERLRTFLAVAK